jgi:hypothetical protein
MVELLNQVSFIIRFLYVESGQFYNSLSVRKSRSTPAAPSLQKEIVEFRALLMYKLLY